MASHNTRKQQKPHQSLISRAVVRALLLTGNQVSLNRQPRRVGLVTAVTRWGIREPAGAGSLPTSLPAPSLPVLLPCQPSAAGSPSRALRSGSSPFPETSTAAAMEMLSEILDRMCLWAFASQVGTLFCFPQKGGSFVGFFFLIKAADISGKVGQDFSSFIKWKQYTSG